MTTLFGVPITSHPMMDGPLGKKPRIRPMPPLPYLDEAVRARFNAWLLQTFGEDECAITFGGKMFVSQQTLQALRIRADLQHPFKGYDRC